MGLRSLRRPNAPAPSLPQPAALPGLPKVILEKKADPDILPGLDDKGKLLGSFEIADQILWGLENGFSLTDLAERYGSEQVEYIQLLVNSSAYYRETPYSLL